MKYIDPFSCESKTIAEKLDNAYYKHDIDSIILLINEAIKLCENNCINKLSKVNIYYSIATSYGDLDYFSHTESNTEKQIYYFRMCNNILTDDEFEAEKYTPYINGLKRSLYINMGICFDKIGRKILALNMYNNAKLIDSNFGMMLGNLGSALYHYASCITDKGHKNYLNHFAYHYLKNALKNNDIDNITKNNFKKIMSTYSTDYIKTFLEPKLRIKQFNYPKNEEQYRKWCLVNDLFLNPLNDLFLVEYCFATDSIQFPNVVTSTPQQPVFHGLFNQLKEEYIYSRFLLYNSQYEGNNVHFADKDTCLINSHDYPLYSIRIENLKTAYKTLYGLFDRCAFLINEYFDLGIKKEHVSFGSIWNHEYKKGKKNYRYKNILDYSENYGLKGLYWIKKDLYECIFSATEPESKYLYTLRNALEHRYVKVFADWGIDRSDGSEDRLAYYISENTFKKYALKLLKLIRELIIYIVIAVNIEEHNRRRNSQETIMPIKLNDYEDEWKI